MWGLAPLEAAGARKRASASYGGLTIYEKKLSCISISETFILKFVGLGQYYK